MVKKPLALGDVVKFQLPWVTTQAYIVRGEIIDSAWYDNCGRLLGYNFDEAAELLGYPADIDLRIRSCWIVRYYVDDAQGGRRDINCGKEWLQRKATLARIQ